MSKLNRLQWILILMSIATCGLSAGFLLSGIPTIIPLVFFGSLVALMASFLIKRPSAPGTARIASYTIPIRHPVVRTPSRTIPVIRRSAPKMKQLAENLWNWVVKQSNSAVNYLKPKLQSAGTRAGKGGALLADNVKQSPALWLGIALALIATYQFFDAFWREDWKMFHAGLITLPAAATFLLYHFNLMGKTRDKIVEWWKVTWLGVSILSFFLILGHGWGLIPLAASVVSAVAAIITLCNGWGTVGNGIGELSSYTFQKFLNFWKGEFGMIKILLVLSLSTLGIIYFFFFGGELLLDNKEGWARLASYGYVVLFLVLMVVAITKAHKKIPTKKK